MEDTTGNLTINEASSTEYRNRFEASTVDQLNLGYSRSAFWLRFAINWTDDKPLLQLSYQFIDLIEVYQPDGKGDFRKSSAGDTLPVSVREFRSPDYDFSLSPAPGTQHTYYICPRSEGSLQLPFFLWSTNEFTGESGETRYLHIAYDGIMIAMIL